MKNNIFTLLCCAALLLFACKNEPAKENSTAKADTSKMEMPKADSVKYTVAMVDNAKDPSCGMPVGAGIDDTAHVKNKVLGFCSKECKEAFMKDAAKNFAAVEWKK